MTGRRSRTIALAVAIGSASLPAIAGASVAHAAEAPGSGAPASVAPASSAPRLRQMLAGASLVVRGTVVGVDPLADGRVERARLQVASVPKGAAPGGAVSVIETRDLPSVPASLADGDAVLVFLRPGETSSSLREQLPGERVFVLAPERFGAITSRSADEIVEVEKVVDRLVAASREPELDPARRATAERVLAFDEIGSRHPRLVEDGALALPGVLAGASSLTDEERTRLEGSLRRRDLGDRVQIVLFRSVAEANLRSLGPLLRGLPDLPPAVQEAAWEAAARLGAPPSAADLERALGARDPGLRAAAARRLLAEDAPGAIDRVGRVASGDPDPGVRKAVIEALGATGKPAALPALERCFRGSDLEQRQEAGRAIFRIGGPAAGDALMRLAFEGPPDEQKHAVALLLALDLPEREKLLERLRREHPDDSVKHLVEQGFEFHHH